MRSRHSIKHQKRQRGEYATPEETADFMVSMILKHMRKSDFQILDPAAGNGVFIRSLLKNGVRADQITAFEIDPEKAQILRELYPKVKIQVHDTLSEMLRKFDACIGNPPYKSRRQSRYMHANRKWLGRHYRAIGLYNLYTLFIYNCVQRLKDGGVLCFIVPDTFMTNRYYVPFRKFLLNSTHIVEILLGPVDLFHPVGADVRTAILTLRKLPAALFAFQPKNHGVRLVDRVSSQQEYHNPSRVQVVMQSEFRRMPAHRFFVGVPIPIIRLVQNAPTRFGDVAKGATGISTGNDKKYLRPWNEVKNDHSWVPFYKSGKRSPYFYRTKFYIERDFEKNEPDPNFMVRNRKFFFREGITCSSVGRRFKASYMPPGCIFGVNANFFFNKKEDLFYSLGYLNSKFCQYLARKVIHRSNIVATSFLEELPYKHPPPDAKALVAKLSGSIVEKLMQSPEADFSQEQRQIDDAIYELYEITPELQREIENFCVNIMKMA